MQICTPAESLSPWSEEKTSATEPRAEGDRERSAASDLPAGGEDEVVRQHQGEREAELLSRLVVDCGNCNGPMRHMDRFYYGTFRCWRCKRSVTIHLPDVSAGVHQP